MAELRCSLVTNLADSRWRPLPHLLRLPCTTAAVSSFSPPRQTKAALRYSGTWVSSSSPRQVVAARRLFTSDCCCCCSSSSSPRQVAAARRRSGTSASSFRLQGSWLGFEWRSKGRSGMGGRRPKTGEDDFEIDDDGGFDVQDEASDMAEEEEEDFRDYDTDYDTPTEYRPYLQRGETESLVHSKEEEEETVVGWKIDEDEFHKMSLLTCDFFIRKVPDQDDNVYDFREMYVTPPDTDIYSIPKVLCAPPKKPVRCSKSNFEYIHTTEPPIDHARSPMAKTEFEVMKVFLIKHFKDRREGHDQFFLDFEEIYVIDSVTKTFTRAEVKVDVPGGKSRDRRDEVLIVREDGTQFSIIPSEKQKSPDQVIEEVHWHRTREEMENYLRGFRDYETSNWF